MSRPAAMNGVEPVFGEELAEPRESDDPSGDVDAMHDRLEADGYLYLPGFHDPERVRAARRDVTGHMAEAGMLDDYSPAEEAIVDPDHDGGGLVMDSDTRVDHPAVLDPVESAPVMSFLNRFWATDRWHTTTSRAARSRPTATPASTATGCS